MAHIDIACTLPTPELAVVQRRYAEAAAGYTATAHIADGRASVRLDGDRAVLRALLTEMIERERQCCSFLGFDVEDAPEQLIVHLTAQVPADEATPLLEAMVATLFPAAVITS